MREALFATTGSSEEKLAAVGGLFSQLSGKINEATNTVFNKSKAISDVLNQLLSSIVTFADKHDLEYDQERVPLFFQN